MSHLPLVPLPALAETKDAAPFVLTGTTSAAGDPAAVSALREALRAIGAPEPVDTAGAAADIVCALEPGGAAESYRLDVEADGIRLSAPDAAGLFYGAQTIAQLTTRAGDAWNVAAVHVEDEPRFAYRGVMLDVARHFAPVETVEAYIDRAASLKFNHLHLHLTDDQGWRLQLPSRPLLTARGSSTSVGGDPGGFYTADDYRRIVDYAAERHLTVVPEIDLPGHTHAVSLAYPEVTEPPVISPDVEDAVTQFGGGLPVHGEPYTGLAVGFSSLRIGDAATSRFVNDVLADVAALTPGPYLHIGGDEAHGTPAAAYTRFLAEATERVVALGKIPIAWHEAGAAGDGADGTLAPGTIGQYWSFVHPEDGADEKTRTFVRGGGRVILSPADAVYLDMKPTPDFPLGLTWAHGATSAQRAYEWDPADVVDGVSERDILGVEAPLWTETVRDLVDIDALAFPRITAAAEIAWSPRVAAARTWTSFRERVAAQAPAWRARGIRFSPLDEIPWGRTADESEAAR